MVSRLQVKCRPQPDWMSVPEAVYEQERFMKLELTPEQEALRKELRAYFKQLMTPELVDEVSQTPGEGGGPLFWKALKKLGKDGWIGVGWPKELGGRGMSELEQFIFVEEVMRAGFPFPFLTTESVGPILAANASSRL